MPDFPKTPVPWCQPKVPVCSHLIIPFLVKLVNQSILILRSIVPSSSISICRNGQCAVTPSTWKETSTGRCGDYEDVLPYILSAQVPYVMFESEDFEWKNWNSTPKYANLAYEHQTKLWKTRKGTSFKQGYLYRAMSFFESLESFPSLVNISANGLNHESEVDSQDDLDKRTLLDFWPTEGRTSIVGRIPSRTEVTRGNMLCVDFWSLTLIKLPIPAQKL